MKIFFWELLLNQSIIWIKIYSYLKFNSIVKRPWTTQFLGLEKQRFSLFTFCCRWFSMSRSLFSWLVTISLFSFSWLLVFWRKNRNLVSLVSHRKILNSECCLKMQNLVINRQFFDIYDFCILKNLLNIYTKKSVKLCLQSSKTVHDSLYFDELFWQKNSKLKFRIITNSNGKLNVEAIIFGHAKYRLSWMRQFWINLKFNRC